MIGVTRDGHVMTLEMQRAERRNALNGELVDGLREAIEKAAAEDVRAIVLTGQGHVFSSGADLSDAAGVADELPDKAKALNIAIDEAPIPVIGAINGPAIGAGVILSMICDLRVVAPDAYFQFPVAKYGLALDNWSIRRLTSLVGRGPGQGHADGRRAAHRRRRAADRDGQPHRHARRRAGLGRRDRRVRAAGAAARQARAQRRRRLRRPAARAHRSCSTGRGPARTSSRRRWPASRSGRRTSRAPDHRCWVRRCDSRSGRPPSPPAAGCCARCRAHPPPSAPAPTRSAPVAQAVAELSATVCSSTSTRRRRSA